MNALKKKSLIDERIIMNWELFWELFNRTWNDSKESPNYKEKMWVGMQEALQKVQIESDKTKSFLEIVEKSLNLLAYQ